MKKSSIIFSLFLSFLILLVYISFSSWFSNHLSRSEIPDFCQGDKHYGNLPYKGGPYCGPTAVSNILVYLDRRNFLNLLPAENPDGFAQFNLIRLLGTEKYMNTMLKTGTEPIDLMYGLEKFVNEQGYKMKIKWKGSHDGGNYSIGKIPDIEWLHKELKENNFAILHIGWYKHDFKKDFYKRIGGHYVTVVSSKDDGLIIHDPAIRSGIIPKDEYCTFKKLKSGILSSWQSYKEYPAVGYSKLEGIKIREDADAAIVDGVVVFRLYPTQKSSAETVKYFAYGSNLSYKRMHNERKVNVLSRTHAVLKDYELKFNKVAKSNSQEGRANIVSSKGMIVEGILYKISEADLNKLDGFEGYPEHYNKVKVMVYLGGGKEDEAFIYIAQQGQTKDGLKPTMQYLDYLLDGKEFISDSYFYMLKSTKTLD